MVRETDEARASAVRRRSRSIRRARPDTRALLAATALAALAALGGCGGGGSSSQTPAPPPTQRMAGYDLVPLWETSDASGDDPFYTTDYTLKRESVVSGDDLDRGAVAWLPCATAGATGPGGRAPDPSAVHDQLGYASITSVPMQYACARPDDTLPLYRLDRVEASGTRHRYTTSDDEASSALAAGWQFVRVEGYLFATQVDGTTPLFRLGRCAAIADGCDPVVRYTSSTDARAVLLADGWSDEGIEGYAFTTFANATASVSATGNVNGIATSVASPIRTPIQNVAPPAQPIPIAGVGTARPASTVSGYLVSESTPRLAGTTRQVLTFTLDTGTLFDAGSNIDHLPVFLRFHAELGSDGFPGLPYDGLGIFLSLPGWNGNFCGSSATTGAQIFVERVANANRLAPALPTAAFVDCAANLVQPLASDHSYSIAVTVTDDAKLGYTVTDRATGSLVASFALHDYSSWYPCPLVPDAGNLSTANAYCANPMSPDRFAGFRSGYLVWPLFTSQPGGAQGTISDVSVQWLP